MAAENIAKWSEVPDEIWELILSKLKGKDRLSSKEVCPRWRKLVYNFAPSSLPWLVLPPKRDGFYFYNHERRFYHMKNIPRELSHDNGACLGSCYGWLLYLNSMLEFMLLNPFSWNRIPLPPLKSFPDIVKVEVEVVRNRIYHEISGKGWTTWVGHVGGGFASSMRSKVVLSSRPNCKEEKTIGVVVMYEFEGNMSFDELLFKNLAFCTTAESKWTKLNEHRSYLDLTSHEQQFYALHEDFSVEVWDFPNASFPIQRTVIKCDATLVPSRIAHDPRRYLRLIKEFWIMKKGEDLLLLMLNKVSCRYKRRGVILVYKLDLDGRWTKMESIGNHTLLLGLNQAILAPGHANLEDFDHKGSVHFINKVSHRDDRGDYFYTSEFKLGGKRFENRKKLDNVRYPYPFDMGPEPDPVFYWVEAPF